jgi:polyisoprenyl-phosphate glycosyltransferase
VKQPFISVVSPTFNEVANIDLFLARVKGVLESLEVEFEIIIIDNDSSDGTVDKLRTHSLEDKRVKVILNESNFGHIRSPYHGLLQAKGDAVVFIASDLQDPPELIPDYLDKWRKGDKAIYAVKSSSQESKLVYALRTFYYNLLGRLSPVKLIPHATGAGMFDKSVIEQLRRLTEPFPYFRGLLPELGYRIATVEFEQPKRKGGQTKNSIWTLFDMALLGMTTLSKAPIRMATGLGFLVAIMSMFVALTYVLLKLFLWQSLDFGITPLIFGVFFLGALQLILLGLIGEYVLALLTRIKNYPLVLEKERINF